MSDAVNCAVTMQRALANNSLDFRMGVNLGDIVEELDDIHGDGVNIAARLEGIADAGGICVSGSVYDQVRKNLDFVFEDLGEQTVKNISTPVRVYKLLLQDIAAKPVAALSDKPSIAVLPFDNMSSDPEQEFFADGITEDIITELTRFSDLFVIARNSTFTYKGRAVKVQDVGKELGVSHVVEGSVRKAGDLLRITAQLIDVTTGKHIWAERFDRQLVDIFELQDEITQSIVGILPGRIERSAVKLAKRKPPADMAAYDYIVKGEIFHHRFTPKDNIEALRLLEKAIELEPDYAAAWAWKACILGQSLQLGYPDDPGTVYKIALEALDKALSLNENDVECHRLLCEISMEEEKWDDAYLHHEKAYSLNPNDARIVAQHGELLTWIGKPDEGVNYIERAMKLDPFNAHKRVHLLGRALLASRQYEAALNAFKKIELPRYTYLADMAACYAQINNVQASKDYSAKVLLLNPEFSAESYVENLTYQNEGDRKHHLECLRNAGFS